MDLVILLVIIKLTYYYFVYENKNLKMRILLSGISFCHWLSSAVKHFICIINNDSYKKKNKRIKQTHFL